MSNKIMIVGTGNVGASIAFAFINRHTSVREIVLVDRNTTDSEGEAMDLCDALSVSPSYVKVRSGSYTDAKDCDIAIITAGAPQKPGETRLDLVKKNSVIIRDVVTQTMAGGFNGIFIVVTNPMDIMTCLTYYFSRLPSNKVIGTGTVLDTSRLQFSLAEYLDVNTKTVHAYQIGEHGDSEFTVWSLASVGGQKVSSLLSSETLANIENSVRNQAYGIINRKGATYYGIAACVTQIVEAILNDEHQILCVSNFDEENKIYYGYPAVIGKNGVERRIKLPLGFGEISKLQESIEVIRKTLADSVRGQ